MGNASEDARRLAVLRDSNKRVEALRLQREQEFMRNEPEYSAVLKIEQVRCPVLLFQFRQELNKLLPGRILKIQSGSGILIKELEAACRILGIEIKTLRYRRQHFLYAKRPQVQQGVVNSIRQYISVAEIVPPASNQPGSSTAVDTEQTCATPDQTDLYAPAVR